MQSGKQLKPWRPEGAPFFWLYKAAADRIKEQLERSAAARAKLIYMGLCRLASDRNSSTFTVSINLIATEASVCAKTVSDGLPDLERIGLISVFRPPGVRVNSTYTVKSLTPDVEKLTPDVERVSTPPALSLPRDLEIERERECVEVEFPRGFPKTETEAIAHAAFVGCTEDFARKVWNEAAGRNGTDMFGQPVSRFRNYLKGRTESERSKAAERNHRNRPAPARPISTATQPTKNLPSDFIP